jgi:hypothetical protein
LASTHIFRFGFLRGGVFWGWPSSHTTIAFAMAVTILMLFPKQKWVGYMAITYALYIGLGVSMTNRDPAGDRTGCRRRPYHRRRSSPEPPR